MKSLRHVLAALAALCLVTAALAADATGTWKVTVAAMTGAAAGGRGGGPRESTLTLAMKDGTLTGSMVSPGRGGGDPVTTQISDASMKDDMVMFSTTREFNGQKIVSKYTGKLDGDTLKGTVEAPGMDGAVTKRDFSATRSK